MNETLHTGEAQRARMVLDQYGADSDEMFRLLVDLAVYAKETGRNFEMATALAKQRADSTYLSTAARQAQASGYGDESYWRTLDESAQRAHDYWMEHDQPEHAAEMFTRALSAALAGNDGA